MPSLTIQTCTRTLYAHSHTNTPSHTRPHTDDPRNFVMRSPWATVQLTRMKEMHKERQTWEYTNLGDEGILNLVDSPLPNGSEKIRRITDKNEYNLSKLTYNSLAYNLEQYRSYVIVLPELDPFLPENSKVLINEKKHDENNEKIIIGENGKNTEEYIEDNINININKKKKKNLLDDLDEDDSKKGNAYIKDLMEYSKTEEWQEVMKSPEFLSSVNVGENLENLKGTKDFRSAQDKINELLQLEKALKTQKRASKKKNNTNKKR